MKLLAAVAALSATDAEAALAASLLRGVAVTRLPVTQAEVPLTRVVTSAFAGVAEVGVVGAEVVVASTGCGGALAIAALARLRALHHDRFGSRPHVALRTRWLWSLGVAMRLAARLHVPCPAMQVDDEAPGKPADLDLVAAVARAARAEADRLPLGPFTAPCRARPIAGARPSAPSREYVGCPHPYPRIVCGWGGEPRCIACGAVVPW